MREEYSERAARELWQGQAVQVRQFSPEELGRLHGAFNRKIKWRNAREYAAGALVVVFFGAMALRSPSWEGQAGGALTVLGCAYVLWHLHRHGSARPEAPAAAASACRDYYRADLQRQRQLLASAGRWYLAPFLPGYLLILAAKLRLAGGVNPNFVISVALG